MAGSLQANARSGGGEGEWRRALLSFARRCGASRHVADRWLLPSARCSNDNRSTSGAPLRLKVRQQVTENPCDLKDGLMDRRSGHSHAAACTAGRRPFGQVGLRLRG
jgi:hypothetical protein